MNAGRRFLSHFGARVPWVIAVVAVLAAVSTGTIWATSRIRSLDTDLSSAGRRSSQFRDDARRLGRLNEALHDRLEQMEAELAEVTNSISELERRNRDLRTCVSKSNPGGGPVVWTVPKHAPVGTRVEMIGHCFLGRFKQNEKDLLSGYGISLLGGIDAQGRNATGKRRASCELIAGAAGDLEVMRDGRMRGYFIVPRDGGCFQSKNKSARVAPGPYYLIIGCHSCTYGRFRVTTEERERQSLKSCRPGDYTWTIEGPDGANGMLVFGVRVQPRRGVSCRLAESTTLTVTGTTGIALPIRGNSATARFDAALGRQRVNAGWGWRNWCGSPGPFEVRAILGNTTKSKRFEGLPRCDFKRRASHLFPIPPVMDGVASFAR